VNENEEMFIMCVERIGSQLDRCNSKSKTSLTLQSISREVNP